MKRKLSIWGTFLLVVIVVLGSLTGCELEAKEREEPATEAADASPAATSATGEQPTAAPGETVVSAVTPMPGAEETPTLVPVGEETPMAPEPTAPAEEQPTAAPPADEPPSGAPTKSVVHYVQPGETLSSIARRYGTTWQAIAKENNLVNPNQISVGQKLRIPGASGTSGGSAGCRLRHTVKRGEWVWQIARNYGVSPYDILAANGLTIQSANTLYPGTVLCIP